MNAAARERALRRARAERRRRRLERRAYGSVYARIAHLVPVVLPLAGETRAFPLEGDPGPVVEALAGSCVFGFETALEIRAGQRLLKVNDLHAYTEPELHPGIAEGVPGLGPEALRPPLVPVLPRQPHLFLVLRRPLPPFTRLEGRRVVSGEWLLREYLGALGHRFDLLAVVLHCLEREGPAAL